jgi:hypothetical protein
VTLSVAIVAHLTRAIEAETLANTVDADRQFVDCGTFGEWANHARALRWASLQDTTHALILQDDAVPIDKLIAHVNTAIRRHPSQIIGLYVGQQRPRQLQIANAVRRAERMRASWLTGSGLWWGVATIYPTALIPELLKYCEGRTDPYDQRVTAWCRSAGHRVRYTWPSLLDHADGPSLVARDVTRGAGRVAHRIGVPNWHATEIAID